MNRSAALITALGVAFSAPALADNTDTGSVSIGGTIVAPLTASATALIMPNVVRPQLSNSEPSGSVTLACDATSDTNNTVTYTSKLNPFANGVATAASPSASSTNKAAVASILSTGQCANVTITGEPNYFFKVSIGTPTLTPSLTGVSLAAGATPCTDQSSNPVTSGDIVQLTGAGTASVRCGAKVTVTNLSTATSYTGSYAITITYD